MIHTNTGELALFLLGNGEIPNYFTGFLWHHPSTESGRKSTPLLMSGHVNPGFSCGLSEEEEGMVPLFMVGMKVSAVDLASSNITQSALLQPGKGD